MYSYYIFITTPQLAEKGQKKWRKVDLVEHMYVKSRPKINQKKMVIVTLFGNAIMLPRQMTLMLYRKSCYNDYF